MKFDHVELVADSKLLWEPVRDGMIPYDSNVERRNRRMIEEETTKRLMVIALHHLPSGATISFGPGRLATGCAVQCEPATALLQP